MLDDDGYKERWEAKKRWYRANDVFPLGEEEGPNGTLVETTEQGGFDSTVVAQKVRELFGAS